MTDRFSRRLFIGALGAGLASGAWGASPDTSLRPNLRPAGFKRKAVAGPQKLIQSAKLGGKITFAVADARTGESLEAHNAEVGTPPASVTKAVTALYALDALGRDHRFRTMVLSSGTLRDGILDGDLILAGGGDPTLDTNHLAELAAQTKAAGIREVRGRFLVWDGALPRIDRIDPGQPDHVGYNPAMSGIALNFNRVHFGWQRNGSGFRVTMDARSDKFRPEVSMAAMEVVARQTPVYTYKSAPNQDRWTVARAALGRDGARWLPVRLPGLYAGEVFQIMARANGILLEAPKVVSRRPSGKMVAVHSSAPLHAILRGMLKFSNNLIAEMVGLAATQARGGSASSLRASAMEMNRWAGRTLGMSQTRLVDHSGLGDASRMTAEEMCTALVRVRSGAFRDLLKPIILRDTQGRPNKNHPIKVNAKTGTLNFVSSLAGYMTAPDGSELAFAIFTADEKTRAGIARANRERPEGARSWNARAKRLQQGLIERWAALYGS